MKKTYFLAAALAGCAVLPGCGSKPENQCTLNGTVNGFEDEWIHLVYVTQDTIEVHDSARIANGAFAFGRALEAPVVEATLYVGNPEDYRNVKYAGVFLEAGEMTVALDTAKFNQPVVTGSVSQAENDSLNAEMDEVYASLQALRDSMQNCPDELRKAMFEAQADSLSESAEQMRMDFVKSHPASFVAAHNLVYMLGRTDYAELKSIYDNMSAEVKQYANLADVRGELAALERTQPGQPAPLFRALSWKGDSIGIADLRGKYVLLDFWASWCVPCRKSFPHVKALYKKYHAKGFEVFCVADNDNSEDKWREAIEKDGVQDFYHVLRGLKWDRSKGLAGMDHSNDISDLYAIHFLPTKYLIDKEGNIIGKFEDAELDAKLKEIFGN